MTTEPSPPTEVSLREINADTVIAICKLEVNPAQKRFVAPNAFSIAEAYFSERAWFRAIYAGDTPVGFLMLDDNPDKPEYYLWRFMIDARYQGRGYGKRALELLIAHVRTRPGARELLLSYAPGEGSPRDFYLKLGFVETGEEEDGELYMRLPLAA